MDQNGRTWLLVLAVVVPVLAYGVLRLVTGATTSIETIKASEFYNMVESRPEDISSIQISKDWIKGTYSAPRQGYTDFRTPRAPEFPLEELEETLIANDMEFDYQEPSRFPEWLGFFAGGGLPLLLIFIGLLLLIFFLYKRIQKRTEETAGASIPEQIEQLAKLKDQGILSEEEFEEKKKELLSKM